MSTVLRIFCIHAALLGAVATIDWGWALLVLSSLIVGTIAGFVAPLRKPKLLRVLTSNSSKHNTQAHPNTVNAPIPEEKTIAA